MLDQETKDYLKDVISETIGIAGQSDALKGRNENMQPLYDAMSKMQASVEGAIKLKKNAYLGNEYADLEQIIKVIREPMANNGLAFSQTPNQTGTILITTIFHESGAYLKGFFPFEPVKDKKGPHGYMSALTYARRGALASMCGVYTTGEDDDGCGAENPPDKKDEDKNNKKEIAPPQKKGKLSKDIDKATKEIREIVDEGKPKLSSGKASSIQKRLSALNNEANEKFKKEMGVAMAIDLRADEFAKASKLVTQLERNKAVANV